MPRIHPSRHRDLTVKTPLEHGATFPQAFPEDIRIAFLCPQSVRRRGGQDADTAHLSA
jgi:hypothetical protein